MNSLKMFFDIWNKSKIKIKISDIVCLKPGFGYGEEYNNPISNEFIVYNRVINDINSNEINFECADINGDLFTYNVKQLVLIPLSEVSDKMVNLKNSLLPKDIKDGDIVKSGITDNKKTCCCS